MTEHAPPTGSRMLVDRRGDDVTLTVPPLGMWALGGPATVSCLGVWFVFCLAVVTVGFGAAWLWGLKGVRNVWPVLLILPVLWLLGLGMLLPAIDMGRRRAVLAVVGETLTVIQTGLFGSRTNEWRRDQIEDIRTGPSNVSIDAHGSTVELQIHPRSGGKFGLLAGRNEAELEWLAALLRGALRLGQGTTGNADTGAKSVPPS